MWALGIETRSSGRAVTAPMHSAISPASILILPKAYVLSVCKRCIHVLICFKIHPRELSRKMVTLLSSLSSMTAAGSMQALQIWLAWLRNWSFHFITFKFPQSHVVNSYINQIAHVAMITQHQILYSINPGMTSYSFPKSWYVEKHKTGTWHSLGNEHPTCKLPALMFLLIFPLNKYLSRTPQRAQNYSR